MSRLAINFLLDGLLLLAFLAVLLTAAMLQTVFPPVPNSLGWTLFGRDYAAWSRVHFFTVLIMAVLIGLHLILHWTWIIGFITSRLTTRLGRRITTNESTRTLYGVCTLITILTILGSALAAASLCIREPASSVAATSIHR